MQYGTTVLPTVCTPLCTPLLVLSLLPSPHFTPHPHTSPIHTAVLTPSPPLTPHLTITHHSYIPQSSPHTPPLTPHPSPHPTPLLSLRTYPHTPHSTPHPHTSLMHTAVLTPRTSPSHITHTYHSPHTPPLTPHSLLTYAPLSCSVLLVVISDQLERLNSNLQSLVLVSTAAASTANQLHELIERESKVHTCVAHPPSSTVSCIARECMPM